MPAGAETSHSTPPNQAEKATGRNIRGGVQEEVGEVKRRKWSHLQGAKGVSVVGSVCVSVSANVSVNVSTCSCLCKVKEEAPAQAESGERGAGGLGY